MSDEIKFYKGKKNIFEEKGEQQESRIKIIKEDNQKEPPIETIQKEIAKVLSSSHLSFLMGAGCSTPAVPTMGFMLGIIQKYKKKTSKLKECEIKYGENLEQLLQILYAKEFYFESLRNKENEVNEKELKGTKAIIRVIKKVIFCYCKPPYKEDNLEKEDSLKTYKNFYRKLMYRENTLSRINIFTTNYDLLNEIAMDDLGIIYCNGFSGNVARYFNPMTFNYAYAEQIGLSDNKYNALDKYIYLYKLHGSVNWIEEKENNAVKLFNIKEVQQPIFDNDHNIMIYPTPTKQSSSFSTPYSDLFREFQKKLLLQDNILVVIGYSFADEHINHIIYQALATIPNFRLVIFSHGEGSKPSEDELEQLKEIDDPRIWIISGKDKTEDIAAFKYIVENFLPEISKDDEKLEKVIKRYINK